VSEPAVRQRLAAILAADAVGYSRLMEADERATAAALDAAKEVFKTPIEVHHGLDMILLPDCATDVTPENRPSQIRSRAPESIDRELAQQIGKHAYPLSPGKHDAVLHGISALGQECVEIGDRAQVNVRRVVPLIRQRF